MNKADLKVLERIFSDDIERAIGKVGRLPTQFSKRMNARLDRLEKDGLIRRDTVILGGRFPVKVSGWALTMAGHATYCMSAYTEE